MVLRYVGFIRFSSPFEYSNPGSFWSRELVLEGVRQNGLALQWACCELRGDHEVVLTAVTQQGRALEFAAGPVREEILLDLERFDMTLSEYTRVAGVQFIIQLDVVTVSPAWERGWMHVTCRSLGGDVLPVAPLLDTSDGPFVEPVLIARISVAVRRPERALRLVVVSVDGAPCPADPRTTLRHLCGPARYPSRDRRVRRRLVRWARRVRRRTGEDGSPRV